jgi:repressor LexA
VLAGAEKRLEFVPFTLPELNPIPYIHACLPVARGTDEQLNQMAFVSLPAKPFTDEQGQYLAFVYAYTRLNRRPPAEIDMRRYFKVRPPSVHQIVLTIEREGFINRQPGVARSIEMLIEPERLSVLR